MPNAKEEAHLFISRCFNNGEPRVISPWFDSTYIINEQKVKFSQNVLEEMLKSSEVQLIYQNEKMVCIKGIVSNA